MTSKPIEGIADIHDRMPLVLAREDLPRWLAGEKPQPTLAGFERYPVGSFVNSPKNDTPECIVPQSPIGRGPRGG